jgi:hypothetical protein
LPAAKEKQVLSMTINKTPVVKTSENEAHSNPVYIYNTYKHRLETLHFFLQHHFLWEKKNVFLLKKYATQWSSTTFRHFKIVKEADFFFPTIVSSALWTPRFLCYQYDFLQYCRFPLFHLFVFFAINFNISVSILWFRTHRIKKVSPVCIRNGRALLP